jgi:hypothetical protein
MTDKAKYRVRQKGEGGSRSGSIMLAPVNSGDAKLIDRPSVPPPYGNLQPT